MTEPTLPPLPPEREMGRNRNDDATVLGYTADQLRAYALAAIEPYRRDAMRYQWLRDVSVPPHNFYISVPDEFGGVRYKPHEVDAYIDAAMRQEGEK